MTLAQTALNAIHRHHGAKLVDFGGWEMPLHYGSQIEEHRAVRRDAGLFDVSHMAVFDVLGRGARTFLRHLLANDVEKLAPGCALYSCLLDESGGVLDDLIGYFIGTDAYRLVVNAATAAIDAAWLERWAAPVSANLRLIARPDVSMIAVQGPNAREKCWAALPGLHAVAEALPAFGCLAYRDYFIARTGYTGEDGFELIVPTAHATYVWEQLEALGVTPCGLGARDTLRLEAGMALCGQDMDATVTPYEAGLGWTVDTSGQRDFIGRAALATRSPRHTLTGLVLLDPGVLRAHQVVHTAHGDGITTSGSFAPTLGRSIAFARLPTTTLPGARVRVELRGGSASAVVVRPPFVRRGCSLIDTAIQSGSPVL